MRTDLLALTADDLATLSNRGTVKWVQREIQEKRIQIADFDEAEDGTITAQWADGITCTLPPQTPLGECRCSCPAVGVCRHLVQTVLYYQEWVSTHRGTTPESEPPKPWNPGNISDESLATVYQKNDLAKARKQFEEPHVIEVVRSIKPLARFHTLPIVVRFLTPGDLHNAICTCAEPAPCNHIPLAVWAFRRLPDGQISGLISTGHQQFSVPEDALNDASAALASLLELGVSGASPTSIRQLRDAIRRCQDEGLVWPAEILSEILEETDRYLKQDARFSADSVADLIGEWVIRKRAIRHQTETVPQIFVRGSTQDHAVTVNLLRLTGLGCSAVTRRGITRLSAYLVDMDSGGILAIQREVSDPKPGDASAPKPYAELARATVLRDNSLFNIGSRQVFAKGGKRTAQGLFVAGRAAASVTPSTFNWETLPTSLVVDSFAESRALRATQPPTCLRPRRVGDGLAVYAIQSVETAYFDPLSQSLIASVLDQSGEKATLIHPFTSRGNSGAERLARWLTQRPQSLRFVAGRAQPSMDTLLIMPIALIFEHNGTRSMLQPWVDPRSMDDGLTEDALLGGAASGRPETTDPLNLYTDQIAGLLGELFLMGLQRVDERMVNRWQQVVQHGFALGLVRFMEPFAKLHEALTQRLHDLAWDWQAALMLALNAAAVCRFAADGV